MSLPLRRLESRETSPGSLRAGSFGLGGLWGLSCETILPFFFLVEDRGLSIQFLNLLTQRNLASPIARCGQP